MRKAFLISAALVVLLSVVSANLWRELRAERRLSRDPHTYQTDAASAGPLASAEPSAVSTTVAAQNMRTAETPPANASPPFSRPALGTIQARDALASPEYRSARLAEQRMSLMRTLPGLVEELALTEAEAGRFFDMLAESRVNRESASSLSIGAVSQLDRREAMLRQQELRDKENESIAATLGPAKYQQWQQYQKTLPARMEANAMGTQLAQVGLPLSSTQQRSLANALVAERERTQGERERLARSVNPADPQTMAQIQEQAMRLQEDSNRRILDSVASSLDANQIETLRKQLEVRLSMDRATSNLSQGR